MKKSENSIKHGDVFQVGEHIIGCGDCRDEAFMKRVLGNHVIKAVIVDPPYGIAVTESKKGFSRMLKEKIILNDHLQSDDEYSAFTASWINPLKPNLARKNSFYIFNADRMIFALRQGMIEAGLKFCQLLIWVKTHAVIGRMDYAPQHELIAYGWFGTHEFMKSKDKSVIVHPKPNKSPFHPTMKPVGLIRHLILNSTKIGDVVCDPFIGSGTAAVACEETKRKCIGVEIDPEYCMTTIERLELKFGLKAKLI